MTTKDANYKNYPSQIDPVKLARIIPTLFDLRELRGLCFNLNVAYDELPAFTRSELAQELVTFLNRRDRLEELIEAVIEIRPNFDLYEVSTTVERDRKYDETGNPHQVISKKLNRFFGNPRGTPR